MIRSLAKKWRRNGEKMAKSIALWRNGIALWRNGIALWRNGIALWRRNGEENGEVIALWRNGIALWRRNGEENGEENGEILRFEYMITLGLLSSFFIRIYIKFNLFFFSY